MKIFVSKGNGSNFVSKSCCRVWYNLTGCKPKKFQNNLENEIIQGDINQEEIIWEKYLQKRIAGRARGRNFSKAVLGLKAKGTWCLDSGTGSPSFNVFSESERSSFLAMLKAADWVSCVWLDLAKEVSTTGCMCFAIKALLHEAAVVSKSTTLSLMVKGNGNTPL
jgi:hypothetical protein